MKGFSIGDERFPCPRRGRDGPSRSEPMSVGSRDLIIDPIAIFWVWRVGKRKELRYFEPVEEMDRQLRYVKTYIIDSSDGLYVYLFLLVFPPFSRLTQRRGKYRSYWRSLRLYAISQEKLAIYRQLTGDNREPEYDQEERLMDDANLALPVAERELCKTLLGNGGAARTFLLAGQYFAAS